MTDLKIIKEISSEVYSDSNALNEIGFMQHRNFRGFSTINEDTVIGLSLQNLKLNQIPNSIFKLKNLETLFLEDNNLTEIPTEIKKLEKLKVIDLSNNNIEVIPAEIRGLDFLSSFHIGGNPIRFPSPEIVSGGISLIKDYFKSINKNAVVLREAKLLIVGHGGVGKTSLMNKFLYDTYDDNLKSTDGIEIDSWETIINQNKFRINIWDFGGQEIYHSTHQFFLTKRSLYILLWDARGEDDILSFDYWLNITSLLSNKSPIIITQNKIDERDKLIDENIFKISFPNICGFQKVSVKKEIGLDQLKNIIKQEIVKLEHIEDKLPGVWIDLREELETLEENYINRSKYLNIASKYGLNESEALNLCGYFHDLGVILFFEENEILRDRIFLKPEWATNAVYKLLSCNDIILKKGEFKFDDLANIWIDYSEEDFIHFIELMKKFELCFKLSNTTKYIIPALLPATRPNFDWVDNNNTTFTFQYKFMPAGIITRLIVKLNDLIFNNTYWKNGVILKWEKTLALIKSDQFEKLIRIELSGTGKSELLDIIRREIYSIHKTLNNPTVSELVPCTCYECLQGDPFLFDFKILKGAYEKNIESIMCQKSYKNQSIINILGKVQPGFKSSNQYIENLTQNITLNETQMKINEIKITDSQVMFSDKIKNVNYNSKLKLTKEDFHSLRDGIASLTDSKRKELVKLITEAENSKEDDIKLTKFEKIKSILLGWGIAISQNVAAAYIFEGLKALPI